MQVLSRNHVTILPSQSPNGGRHTIVPSRDPSVTASHQQYRCCAGSGTKPILVVQLILNLIGDPRGRLRVRQQVRTRLPLRHRTFFAWGKSSTTRAALEVPLLASTGTSEICSTKLPSRVSTICSAVRCSTRFCGTTGAGLSRISWCDHLLRNTSLLWLITSWISCNLNFRSFLDTHEFGDELLQALRRRTRASVVIVVVLVVVVVVVVRTTCSAHVLSCTRTVAAN